PPVIYPLSLHDALPIFGLVRVDSVLLDDLGDRLGRQGTLVDELAHRREHDEMAIDLEVTTQAPAEVRATEAVGTQHAIGAPPGKDRKSTRLNSSHVKIS